MEWLQATWDTWHCNYEGATLQDNVCIIHAQHMTRLANSVAPTLCLQLMQEP